MDKKLQCAACKKFVARAAFARHRRLHEGDKHYRCRSAGCTSVFSRRDALSRHTKFHEQDFAHVCNDCGKRFVQSIDLRRHQGSHLRQLRENTAAQTSAHVSEDDALLQQVAHHENAIALLRLQFREPQVPSRASPQASENHTPTEDAVRDLQTSPRDSCDCQQFSLVGSSMPCQISFSRKAQLTPDEWVDQL
jgi:uncharacterized Zn-finger protein